MSKHDRAVNKHRQKILAASKLVRQESIANFITNTLMVATDMRVVLSLCRQNGISEESQQLLDHHEKIITDEFMRVFGHSMVYSIEPNGENDE